MAQTRYYSATAQKTTLVGGVDLAATSLTVAALNGYPASYPYTIVVDRDTIDEEVMEVTGATGTVLTVTRGVDGVPAVAHVVGATVEHGTSARDFREADQHRGSAENVHGIKVGSAVVGTTDTQTLTNKTLDEPVLINPTLKGEVIDGGDHPQGDINVKSDIDMNNYQIHNLADGTEDDHAINKGQLDAAIDLVDSATVDAGTTTTGAPGTNASVVNSGTQYAAVFDFTIPRGEAGADGAPFTYDDFTPEQLEELKGEPGKGVQVKGTVNSSSDLPADAEDGDVWIALDTGDGWVYDADTGEWSDIGPIRGPEGPAGQNGEDGADGKGWTGGSYSSGTGKVTFTSDDGLGFETGDLRGDPGPAVDLPAADAADKVLTSTGTSEGDYEWADPQGGGGIDLTSDRESQLIQGDGSGGWTTGMGLKVVQDLPADDDPAYAIGDAVFVLGDVDPKGSGPAVVSSQSGGTVQSGVSIDGKTYDIHTFTDDSATNLSLTVSEPGFVDALIVAGGGGGGGGQNAGKGGGGAGGLLNTSLVLEARTYEVKVGNGGAGGGDANAPSGGQTGGDSIVFGLTAFGGGGGGYSPSYNTGVVTAGLIGGSGGGGNPPGSALPYLSIQGNPGDGYDGGGAGGPGDGGGDGGPGFVSSITGTELEYSIGGNSNANDAPTTPGSGGKAGAAYAAGYAGQAGIVIVRVEV